MTLRMRLYIGIFHKGLNSSCLGILYGDKSLFYGQNLCFNLFKKKLQFENVIR